MQGLAVCPASLNRRARAGLLELCRRPPSPALSAWVGSLTKEGALHGGSPSLAQVVEAACHCKILPYSYTHHHSLAQVVEAACQNATQAAREFREAVRDEADLRDTTGVELVPGGGSGRNRSMALVKAVKRGFAECAHIPEANACAAAPVRTADRASYT